MEAQNTTSTTDYCLKLSLKYLYATAKMILLPCNQ